MLTPDLNSKINAVWNAFWTGGISNPLEVIEQITYLLFLRRLDDLDTLGGSDSTCARHMKDARFTIPAPALLAKVVDLIADIPMEDRDTRLKRIGRPRLTSPCGNRQETEWEMT